ncbi:MAG: hypothetical protein KME07_18310 [Pegethrix bostrychoides GSE-TBD4-15B]|uniref:Uncharacterized protein n=1 Tax=Pegethrix bostrychoides GSE-TBD4-15B TaxID=2839662 RepID=A0A951U627_9CYAN|nr:hypothetical protein [Pegethrix bostrychoides GSE-TBD4-15B]
MNHCKRQIELVADRVTVDIEGLRAEIEAAYSDNPLWEELSLSQKLRRLIQERLNAIQQEQLSKSESKPEKSK